MHATIHGITRTKGIQNTLAQKAMRIEWDKCRPPLLPRRGEIKGLAFVISVEKELISENCKLNLKHL